MLLLPFLPGEKHWKSRCAMACEGLEKRLKTLCVYCPAEEMEDNE